MKLQTYATSVLLLALSGCCMDCRGFVATQRAFADVVLPAHRAYVEQDLGLSPAQKKSRLDLLDAEEAVLREAEAAQ